MKSRQSDGLDLLPTFDGQRHGFGSAPIDRCVIGCDALQNVCGLQGVAHTASTAAENGMKSSQRKSIIIL
jgi:hypothetical protein